jgi:predicted ArsR family transcriptional regulator
MIYANSRAGRLKILAYMQTRMSCTVAEICEATQHSPRMVNKHMAMLRLHGYTSRPQDIPGTNAKKHYITDDGQEFLKKHAK